MPWLLATLAGCGTRPLSPHVPVSRPEVPATQRPYQINGHTYYPLPCAEGFVEVGPASWYGKKFHGRKTANGERYNMHALTAAHRVLPMDTLVRVLNVENGREVVVRINDRGPFVKDRIIDLSYAGAKKLGMLGPGTARVRMEALGEAHLSGGRLRFTVHPDYHTGVFYIQVGAFSDLANARRLWRRLASQFGNVAIDRHHGEGQTFYRVWIFAATNYAEAVRLEGNLERNGFPEAFVVTR